MATNYPPKRYLLRVFKDTTDYMAVIKIRKNGKQAQFFLNPAAYAVLGIKKNADVSSMTIDDIYPSWSAKIIKEEAIPTALQKGVWRGKIALKNKEGKEIPISQKIIVHKNTKGEVKFFSTIARKIAEFRQKEQESKLYQTALSRYISDAVIITDNHMVIQTWNTAAEKLYGWKKQEVLYKLASKIIPSKYLTEKKTDALTELKMKGMWKGEVVQKSKDGKEIYISSSMSVIKDTLGRITGYIAINRDITEQKEMERRKDDFINLASHELKTPITSTRVFAYVLQKKLGPAADKQILRFVKKMNKQLDNLNRLVNKLLDTARMDKGNFPLKKQRFSIKKLVKEVVKEVQITKPHRFVLELGADEAADTNEIVYADKERIHQVLSNLVNNAVKYSPEKTPVTIHASKKGEYMEISVKDYGIGIAKHEQKKIFERFYQVKNHSTYSGLGLGLYISSHIIRQHGGNMWVKSKEKKGSTFYFTLPLAKKSI